jgi:predicted Zn-dependent peptidase
MNSPLHWTLNNGIRVIFLPTESNVAHCGLLINAGSRDENTNEHGIAHYIEHCVFKGTKRRKSFHILTRMEDVGGELNAYTTKEETCIYSSFLSPHLERALELLTDMAFGSNFPDKEIAKEKSVITDEILAYKDNPSEEIYDRFEDQIYKQHPLGHDILGTVAHLNAFKREDLFAFTKRCWNTDQMVLSLVGPYTEKKVRTLLHKTLGQIEENKRSFQRQAPEEYVPLHHTVKRKNHQAHLVLGAPAYGVRDSKRTALILLNNLLGGPGMSSRLNLSIREKYGFTYAIDSSYVIYSDTGLFSIYLGTESSSVERCRELVYKELKKLREVPLSSLQLQKAQNQLKGQIAMAQESNNALMLGFAKTYLLFNRIDTFDEIAAKIDSISAKNLQDIACEIFDEKQLSSLLYTGN